MFAHAGFPGINDHHPFFNIFFLQDSLSLIYPEKTLIRKDTCRDFPGDTVVKNPPANAGDMGSSPGPDDPTCRGATKPMHHNY